MAKLIYGKGVYKKGLYKASINGKDTKEYIVWRDMLKRCYNPRRLIIYSSYNDCSVCEKWLDFQIFAEWFNINYKEGYELDKDIIVKGNKVYGPETCCFIPHEINILLSKRRVSRSSLPIGVIKRKTRYVARMSKNGCQVHLGTFNTITEAFDSYKTNKETHIKEVAVKWIDSLTPIAYNSLYNYKIEITD